MTLPLPTPDDLDFNEAGHIMLPETFQHQPGIIRTSTGTRDQKLVIDIPVRTLLGWNGHCLEMLSCHIYQHLTLPASPGRELLQSCCACTSSPPSSNRNSSNMKNTGETNGSCFIFWRIAGYFSSLHNDNSPATIHRSSPRLSETTYPAPFLSS